MNDKVYVKIRGLSAQEAGDAYKEAEDIEIISVGRYTRRAGKEYIRYEEVYDGESAKSDTLIKISEDRVEISKKGAITTIMEFIQDKKTVSCYNTPYGGLAMSIYTSMLDVERDEDKINIALEYTMDVNGQQMSECKVRIEICNQGKLEL